MGNKGEAASEELWDTVGRTDKYSIKRNKQNYQVEEYSEVVPSRKDLAYRQQALQNRKKNFSSASKVVQLYSYKSEEMPATCANNYRLITFTERIPSLLSGMKKKSEDKTVYVLSEALEGFYAVSRQYGFAYDVTPGMIGFNRNFEVKVWFNSNFSKCEPELECLGTKYNKVDHHHRLVAKIFDVVEEFHEGGSYTSRFKNYRSFNLDKPYRFEPAIAMLKEYAARTHPEIFQDSGSIKLEDSIFREEDSAERVVEQHYSQVRSKSLLKTTNMPSEQPIKHFQYRSALSTPQKRETRTVSMQLPTSARSRGPVSFLQQPLFQQPSTPTSAQPRTTQASAPQVQSRSTPQAQPYLFSLTPQVVIPQQLLMSRPIAQIQPSSVGYTVAQPTVSFAPAQTQQTVAQFPNSLLQGLQVQIPSRPEQPQQGSEPVRMTTGLVIPRIKRLIWMNQGR